MQIQPTKIISGERITLPRDFLAKTKLKEGDFVGYYFLGNDLVLTEIKVEKK